MFLLTVVSLPVAKSRNNSVNTSDFAFDSLESKGSKMADGKGYFRTETNSDKDELVDIPQSTRVTFLRHLGNRLSVEMKLYVPN